MPDWSYQTILKPLLLALPPAAARELSLGFLGALGRTPGGTALIDFLGHMRPPEAMRSRHLGLSFPSPVGLSCALDSEGRASVALARFGVGFLEVGPITRRPRTADGAISRNVSKESITLPGFPSSDGLEATVQRLARAPRPGVPLLARLTCEPGTRSENAVAECHSMIERLGPYVDAFVLAPGIPEDATPDTLPAFLAELVSFEPRLPPRRPLLLCLPCPLPPERADQLAAASAAAGLDGLLVDGAVTANGGRELGPGSLDAALRTVARLRARARSLTIVGSGGVHQPEDALRLLEAGADLVQIDSGLVFGGPGLPKRTNEALLFARYSGSPNGPTPRPAEQSWLWALLLGLGMLFGSVLALGIALTRVVLPYDEQFAGLTRAQMHALNDHLLPFLTHDRVALAGTMIAIGILYSGLALFGMRRGQHWARVAVLSSACAGSATFLLFLGFGYFDPFHAFVTAVLCQFLLLAFHCRSPEPHRLPMPDLRNDRSWKWSQWGQLGLICQAAGFIGAGFTISLVGVTSVFVPEDLEFMRTTAEALRAASPHLVPMVAHDRASLGGMLLAAGIAFLLAGLWGVRRGARWLWWTMLLAGLPGYGAAIGVHYAVGYHNPWHLAPAYAGFTLFAVSMALIHPYLCASDQALVAAWKSHRVGSNPCGTLPRSNPT